MPKAFRTSRMGDCIKVFIAEVLAAGLNDKRAFENTGEGIVILLQKSEPAKREQVLYGDVLPKLDAVGAGDRNREMMKLAQHGVEKAIAGPDQDENVAGHNRAAARFDD